MGTNPQEPLAQGDEIRDMLDPIGIKMLQLHLVVIQQPPKKHMGRDSESLLMEESKRHDIPLRRRWLVLITGQQPLRKGGQRAKEAAIDEALQALRGDVGSTPWLH